jgi:hypothetical protein
MEPLILRRAVPARQNFRQDIPTDSDPLPATVGFDSTGGPGPIDTRLTAVGHETTDDQ